MNLIPAILLFLGGIGYAVLTGLYPDVAWMASPLARTFWPVAVVAAGGILMLLTGNLRQRDRFALACAITGAAGCLLLGPLLVAKFRQEAMDAEAAIRLSETREELQTAIRRRLQEETRELKHQQAQRGRDRFTQYEGRLGAASLAAIRQLDTAMQAEVEAQAAAYESALLENPTLGPNSWVTFQTLQQLEAERRAHQRLYAATRTFMDFVDSFEETYTSRIGELGLKPPADRVAIAEMERILQAWEHNQTYALRRLDVEILSAALAALNILHEEWDAWKYNPRDEELSFDNPPAEAAFAEALHRLKAASEAVSAIRDDRRP